ncbi:MAG: dihydrolipoyl dehydrogenase [Aquisalimonadaceae bacterium]
MQQNTFDLIVVGAGPGGYVAALRAAQLGLRTAIVEREHLGGICLNWGCIPAKSLLRSAEVLDLMRRAEEFGLGADNVRHDLAAIVARSREVVTRLTQGVRHLLRKGGVTIIEGEATLPARGLVAVTDAHGKTSEYRARDIVIATGARARELPGLESDGRRVWTYRHALVPETTPERLLIVGSGAIGIEFASFYRALGTEVTVVEVRDRILPAEDAEISELAGKQFTERGIRVLTSATVSSAECHADKVICQIRQGDREHSLEVDNVISAVGITGNVEGLGLEALGVMLERNQVVVDACCRTDVAGIWAIGDVAGAPWLAHKASHEGTMVAELIAGGSPSPVEPTDIPRCTYSQPQIASVGLTEEQARAHGRRVKVGRFPFQASGKALAQGEPQGLVKTIFDDATGELLGAHMIGADVTELIHGYTVSRTLETTGQELMDTVFPHPTLSEALHESVLSAYGRALHY